jgi:hypothetical protein
VTDPGRRPLLEAIAFGDHPKVTPGDRLRALELLRDEAPGEGIVERHVRELSGAELDADLDSLLARFPRLSAAAERRAREIADANRIEREIERRAMDEAKRMYAELVAAQPLAPSEGEGQGPATPEGSEGLSMQREQPETRRPPFPRRSCGGNGRSGVGRGSVRSADAVFPGIYSPEGGRRRRAFPVRLFQSTSNS